MAHRALVVALALAAGACSFEATYDKTSYRCGADGTCPTGFECVTNFCVQSAPEIPDGATPVDAAPGVDAPQPEPDASPAPDAPTPPDPDAGVDAGAPSVLFRDDFDDGVLTGWMPWTHTGCTVVETGGALQLDYSGSGEAYCGVDSNATYDLRGHSVAVEVVAAPVLDNFEAYLDLFSSGGQQLLLIRDPSGVTVQVRNGGQLLTNRTVSVALSAQRYWRIRETGGTIYWETSPDGTTWTIRHSTATSIDVSALLVELAAGHYSPGPGQTVRVRYDHLVVQ